MTYNPEHPGEANPPSDGWRSHLASRLLVSNLRHPRWWQFGVGGGGLLGLMVLHDLLPHEVSAMMVLCGFLLGVLLGIMGALIVRAEAEIKNTAVEEGTEPEQVREEFIDWLLGRDQGEAHDTDD